MAQLKQFKIKIPTRMPQGNQDIINQGSRGSNRSGSTQEVGNIKSKNYVEGEQGWKLSNDGAKFNDGVEILKGAKVGNWNITDNKIYSGNLEIDSSAPKIIMKDGSDNTRLFIGNA